MAFTPADIEKREKDANWVREYHSKYSRLPTEANKRIYEGMAAWFEKKYKIDWELCASTEIKEWER